MPEVTVGADLESGNTVINVSAGELQTGADAIALCTAILAAARQQFGNYAGLFIEQPATDPNSL
jgi:exonuclease VII small subunit